MRQKRPGETDEQYLKAMARSGWRAWLLVFAYLAMGFNALYCGINLAVWYNRVSNVALFVAAFNLITVIVLSVFVRAEHRRADASRR